jgi:hypothetical protein
MTTIKWIPAYSLHNVGSSEDIVLFEPEPAFKFFTQNRNASGYLRCPAFSTMLKNTFVIRSPYDLTIFLDRNRKSVKIQGYDQNFFQKNIQLHEISSPTDPMMVALPPRYIFITDSKRPVNIVSLPMILQPNKNGLIPGTFDITRWIRPIEYSIEVYDDTVPIEIKRGEPLFMVKFITEDDSSVTLEKDIMSPELADIIDRCISVKNTVKGQNLKSLYNMAHGYIELMKARIFKKKKFF